jgi:Mrp family chromosome partitioning ATPase
MGQITHKILVLSGKGGVGKSTVAAQLSLALAASGSRVGLLDIDLCGPSIPKMLGLDDSKIQQSAEGWVPVPLDGNERLFAVSIGFLLPDKEAAVVWRGPKKTAMVRQFLVDVIWGELDYLIVDTPPGTSDEHIAVTEMLLECGIDGAIMVTTPQLVSLVDVSKEVTFCAQIGLPILGVVENMSGFVCPCCGEVTHVFSSGGGESLASKLSLPFLGSIPLDPNLGLSADQGSCIATAFPQSPCVASVRAILEQLEAQFSH